MMFKAMVTAEGLAKMIAPDINVIEEARPYILRMVTERYSLKRISQEGLTELRSFARFAHNLPVAGREILRQIEAGELRIVLSLPEVEALRQTHTKTQRRSQQAVVFAALIISATFALPLAGPMLGRFSLIPSVLFGLALVNGFSLLVGWWRQR